MKDLKYNDSTTMVANWTWGIFVFELEMFLASIADLQISNSNESNQNLEKLYIRMVGWSFGWTSPWQQFWYYSGLWTCWLVIDDWCLKAVSGLSLDCL